MLQVQKLLLSFLVMAVVVGSYSLGLTDVAQADDSKGIACKMTVVVESRNSSGVIFGTETYQKEFSLQEGDTFFDDFSTRIRFKFFTASLQKVDGEKTVSINWFADVTVFNSVDFNTSVTLADGQKSGKVAGDHALYTSGGSTVTRFTLECVEN